MIPYNTFSIDPATYQIFKDNKEFFTAWHQRSWTLDQAKATIDQSIEAKEAMDKLPDLEKAFKGFVGHCELENRAEEMERETERVNEYYAIEQEPDLKS